MQVNYDICRAKAYQLKRSGFGQTIAIIAYNLVTLDKVSLDELTQIVAIAYYRSRTECKNFYSILQNEIARTGAYKNRNNVEPYISDVDFKDDTQVKQLFNLYTAVGFDLFYKLLNIQEPKSTVRKWCWKAFAKRKTEGRSQLRDRKEVKRLMSQGARVRFSKTSSSVYIENNEDVIRISDHEASNHLYKKNIIISC